MSLLTYNLLSEYLNTCVLFTLKSLLEINFECNADIELCKNAIICSIVSKNSDVSEMIREDTNSIIRLLNNSERVEYVVSNFANFNDGYHFLAIDTEIRRFIVKNNLRIDGSRTKCDFNKMRQLLSV